MSTMDGAGTTETNRTAGGGLAEIGALLRRRREELGQDIATIAAATHIRQHYLKAIEDGHRKELPGTAYMIGYIRTYADYLGFDGNRLITDYHADLAGQRKWAPDKRAEPAAPAASSFPQIQLTPAMLLAALLVLGIGIYMAWGYFSSKDEGSTETAALETPAPEAAAPAPAVAPVVKPPAVSPTGAEASPPPPAEPAAAATREPVADDQVPPEADVASTGEDAIEDTPPQQDTAAADAKAGKVVVRARLESWVQIADEKKQIVFSRVLRVGETYTVPEQKGLTLTTGNAGGIDILLNGKKLKSLGAVGLVKRDIPLDPKKLKDGSAFKATTSAN